MKDCESFIIHLSKHIFPFQKINFKLNFICVVIIICGSCTYANFEDVAK